MQILKSQSKDLTVLQFSIVLLNIHILSLEILFGC